MFATDAIAFKTCASFTAVAIDSDLEWQPKICTFLSKQCELTRVFISGSGTYSVGQKCRNLGLQIRSDACFVVLILGAPCSIEDVISRFANLPMHERNKRLAF